MRENEPPLQAVKNERDPRPNEVYQERYRTIHATDYDICKELEPNHYQRIDQADRQRIKKLIEAPFRRCANIKTFTRMGKTVPVVCKHEATHNGMFCRFCKRKLR